MVTRITIPTFAAVLLASVCWLPCEAQPPVRSLRIGLINTVAPGMTTGLLALAMKPFREYVEGTTGNSGEIVRCGDAYDLAKQLADDKVQIAIFHGHEYAWAKAKHPTLDVLVVCLNHLRVVRANLVVASKNAATSYTDLAGTTVALPKDGRDHCRLFFEQRCVKPGVDAEKFYGRLERPLDTDDALDDVVEGRVQSAIVDANALDRYKKGNASRAGLLRVVAESEAFPPGVIAYFPSKVVEAEVKKLREALVTAKDTPRGKQSLQILKLATFEETPGDFEATLKAIVKAYPPPLGK